MEAVAELTRLDVADKAVNLRDRFCCRRSGGESKVLLDAGGLCLGADCRDQPDAARLSSSVGST